MWEKIEIKVAKLAFLGHLDVTQVTLQLWFCSFLRHGVHSKYVFDVIFIKLRAPNFALYVPNIESPTL